MAATNHKSAAASYFAWALNMCLCAGGSGLFIDLIPEDGQLREFGPDEESVLGQSFERMATNRFKDCGTISRVQCGEHMTPEVFYVAVAHALRTVDAAIQAQKQKDDRDGPIRHNPPEPGASSQPRPDMVSSDPKAIATLSNLTSAASMQTGFLASGSIPSGLTDMSRFSSIGGKPVSMFGDPQVHPEKKDTSAAAIAPHIFIVQDVDRAPPRTIECLTEMLSVRLLSAPPGMTVGILPDLLQIPQLFIVVAISARVPRPSATTNFSTDPLEGRLSDRFLNGFFMRIPIVLPKQPPARSTAPPKLSRESLKQYLHAVPKVHMDPSLVKYIRDCVSAVRAHPLIASGLPPRAVDVMCLAARAQAALRASRFVVPDDVAQCIIEVMSHRVIIVPSEVLPPDLTEENAVYLARMIVAAAVSSVPVVR